jgi:NAD-dependent dihydropyrimidine dehydrogenase PreA subunit
MSDDTVKLIYFSPTQTTKKILQGIAQGMSVCRIEHLDLTLPQAETQLFDELADELTILGAPVYAGRLPIEAVRRLRRLKARETPAVVVVVYGNREYEDALLELKNLAGEAVITEPERCLLCQACVKNCPTGARVMEVERIKKVADWLRTNYARRKEPEMFL